MEGSKINRILVISTLVLVFTPLIFSFLKPIKLKELSGAYILPDTVGLNWSNWHEGEFQQKFNQFYEYQVGMRPLFIRLRNQFAFSVFGQSTSYVTIGRDENLYTWGYLEAYKGLNYPNKKQVEDSVSYILALDEALKERGVKLVVIIAPNKVRSFPEILNEKDAALPMNTSYYDLYLKKLSGSGVKIIDMNKWFVSMSHQSKHPLFPSTGIHWSSFGASLASDSIIKCFENLLGKDMLDFKVSNYTTKKVPDHSEIDLMSDLNLLFDFYPKNLVYPEIKYNEKEKQTKYKPNVWVISDSFYWNLFGLGLQDNHFSSESEFWFYANTAYGNGVYFIDESIRK